MDYLNRAVNAVKDGYLFVIEGITAHPHLTAWVGVGLIALALVF